MTTPHSLPPGDTQNFASAATANSIGSSRKPFESRRKPSKGWTKKNRPVTARSPEQWELIHHHPYGRVAQVEDIENWLQEVLLPWEKESLERYRKQRHEEAMARHNLWQTTRDAFGLSPEAKMRHVLAEAFESHD